MNPSELKLIKDRLLIEPDSKESKLGSIIIPEKYRESQETGTVISAGPGKRDNKTGRVIPMLCKAGDKVLFNKEQFETLKLGSKEYYMLNDHEVLAVLG
jgi:chaperonin GroES